MVFEKDYTTISIARATGRGHCLWLEAIKSVFVVLLLAAISDTLATFIKNILFREPLHESYAMLLYSYELLVSVFLTMAYCRFAEHRQLQSMGITKHVWKSYGFGALIGLCTFSADILLCSLLRVFRFTGTNHEVNLGIQILWLGGYLIQGLSEELLFRGYIFVSAARKNSMISAGILSAALFSLFHIFNDGIGILSLINLFLFGIFEVVCFLFTDSIWLAAAVHSIWNYAQGCIYGFNVSGISPAESFFFFEQSDNIILTGGQFGPEGSIITTVILICVIIIIGLKLHKKDYHTET